MNSKEREQLYTVRWHVREKWGEPSAKQDVLHLLGQLLDPAVTPEERPSGLVAAASRSSSKSSIIHQTWFGETIPNDQVRTITRQTSNQQPGAYQKFTQAQETALLQLLKWLHQNNPGVFSYDHVLGHDEVSPTRKNDPGGALSLTMPELRKKLKGL